MKVLWEMWATKAVEDNGSFYVDTPISIERGFKTGEDAIAYAKSYGNIDARVPTVILDRKYLRINTGKIPVIPFEVTNDRVHYHTEGYFDWRCMPIVAFLEVYKLVD